jgi:hypothetical protein
VRLRMLRHCLCSYSIWQLPFSRAERRSDLRETRDGYSNALYPIGRGSRRFLKASACPGANEWREPSRAGSYQFLARPRLPRGRGWLAARRMIEIRVCGDHQCRSYLYSARQSPRGHVRRGRTGLSSPDRRSPGRLGPPVPSRSQSWKTV